MVVTAQPGEGDLGRRFLSRAADLSEFPDQGGGRPEIRGFEQIVLRADAVLRPLAVMILAGQQAFPDRAPSQDGDALPLAVRQNLLLDVALQHVVADLVGRDIGPR